MSESAHSVLVTGASGYIGSRLVAPLADAGYRVRLAARNPSRIPRFARARAAEVVVADAFDDSAVRRALDGIQTAFYLVHTLGGGAEYAERDRRAAGIFAAAARDAGVSRIVFLGGLGQEVGVLSEHLSSRHEVGRVLGECGVPVVEMRASVVIGSGSTSFEMIRNLTEKLPVMTTPRWVRMGSQPIAMTDVASYAIAAMTVPLDAGEGHRIYEIGGSDVVTYGDLLPMYAQRRGLKRLVIPVPFLSPRLSGWWLYLFTPRQATVGRQLAESLRHPTVVTDPAASQDFPEISPMGAAEALDLAFHDADRAFAAIRWSEEYADSGQSVQEVREGRYVDSRTIEASCPPEAAFDPIACIGAEKGWYAFDTLWDIRGFVDIILGGPGHRRGRRDQFALVEGDYLEWWRVEQIIAPTLLRLHAEMKMPGEGWLQYELAPASTGTTVRQTAVFDAKGITGRLYWYAVAPFHHFVFNGTLKGIDRECRTLLQGPNTCPLPGRWERSAQERGAADPTDRR